METMKNIFMMLVSAIMMAICIVLVCLVGTIIPRILFSRRGDKYNEEDRKRILLINAIVCGFLFSILGGLICYYYGYQTWIVKPRKAMEAEKNATLDEKHETHEEEDFNARDL